MRVPSLAAVRLPLALMPHVELVGDELVVTTSWTENKIIEQVPGLRWRSQTKDWRGPATWGTCVVLRGVFDSMLTVGSELTDWSLEEYRRWIYPNMQLRDATEPDSPHQIYDERLYPYQNVGVNFLLNADALLADEMGLGKTVIVLTALRELERRELGVSMAGFDPPDEVSGLPALVICPNSVKEPWSEAAATWFPEATPYVIGGGAQGRRKQLESVTEDPSALVIINYEAVKLHSRLAPYGSVRLTRCMQCGGPDPKITPSRCHKHPKELNMLPWRTVVVDEAHRMKDPTTQQTRACWAVMHQDTVRHRWALTGTPIAENVADLWSIMHGVAPLDFPTKSRFIDRFALLGWGRNAHMEIVGVRPDTRAEFDKIVQPRLRRMLKAVVKQDLPPKVRTYRQAPMSQKQARAYKEMDKYLLTELDNRDLVVSKNNLTKATRLLQFSSSYAELFEEVDENGKTSSRVVLSEPSPKLDVMEEIIDELGDRQVAICAVSRQLIELAAARLDEPRGALRGRPTTHRLLTGSVPTAQRSLNVQEFQNGDAQCMLFTMGAGGVGITLTAADTIIFLQRSWYMVENIQAEDRVHRVGSERHESIGVIDVVAPSTIETKRQLPRLREKLDALDEVVQDGLRLATAGLDTTDLQRRYISLRDAVLL